MPGNPPPARGPGPHPPGVGEAWGQNFCHVSQRGGLPKTPQVISGAAGGALPSIGCLWGGLLPALASPHSPVLSLSGRGAEGQRGGFAACPGLHSYKHSGQTTRLSPARQPPERGRHRLRHCTPWNPAPALQLLAGRCRAKTPTCMNLSDPSRQGGAGEAHTESPGLVHRSPAQTPQVSDSHVGISAL